MLLSEQRQAAGNSVFTTDVLFFFSLLTPQLICFLLTDLRGHNNILFCVFQKEKSCFIFIYVCRFHTVCIFYNVLYKWLRFVHYYMQDFQMDEWLHCTALRSTGFYTTKQLNLNYRESVLDKRKNTQKHSNLDQREIKYLTPVWSFPGRKLLKGNTITRNFSRVKYVRRRTDTWEKIITMKNRNGKSELLDHKCSHIARSFLLPFFL